VDAKALALRLLRDLGGIAAAPQVPDARTAVA
jgi:hypothetical protein